MLKSYRGVEPIVAANAFIEDTAVIIGDVVIGSDSSVWFHAVVRGDVHRVRIGPLSDVGAFDDVRRDLIALGVRESLLVVVN